MFSYEFSSFFMQWIHPNLDYNNMYYLILDVKI